MKLAHVAAPLVLFASLALGLGACAKGSKTIGVGVDDLAAPTEPTEPEEPTDSITVPPETPGGGDEPSGDAGTSDADAGATPGGGGPAGDAGSGCVKVPPSNACGLAPQCGCASSQTCAVTDTSTGAVSCVAAGDRAQGSPCTVGSQCAQGLTCAYGACRPYCPTKDADCAGAGLGKCSALYDPPGEAVPNAKVCTLDCDLRAPSAACGANTCVWDSTLKTTDCDRPGTKDVHAGCTKYNECKPGLACVAHPLFGPECERWCRVGTPGDCSVFEACVDVYGADAPKDGASKLGHCQ